MKISDKITPEELLTVIDELNPNNVPGRLSIIVRMGADKLREMDVPVRTLIAFEGH